MEHPAEFRLQEDEVEISAIRAQGAGGQNVNKVSSAIHLRFDVTASSLPPEIKERLLALADARLTSAGVFVLKAQRFRTQEKNRLDAMVRLHEWVHSVAQPPKPRKATKPTYASKQRVKEAKSLRSVTKTQRRRVLD